MDHTASEQAIDAFWRTVLGKCVQLEAATSADNDAYDACLASLHAIDEGLYLEFSTSEKPCELIVTAEGDRSLFPLVQEIVTRAPKLSGWTVLALKPKLGFPAVTRWEGVDFRTSEISFDPLVVAEGDDRLALRFYVPNLQPEDRTSAHNALLRACDHGLGEKAFADSIGYTEVVALPSGRRPDEFIALVDLERYLQWVRDRKRPARALDR